MRGIAPAAGAGALAAGALAAGTFAAGTDALAGDDAASAAVGDVLTGDVSAGEAAVLARTRGDVNEPVSASTGIRPSERLAGTAYEESAAATEDEPAITACPDLPLVPADPVTKPFVHQGAEAADAVSVAAARARRLLLLLATDSESGSAQPVPVSHSNDFAVALFPAASLIWELEVDPSYPMLNVSTAMDAGTVKVPVYGPAPVPEKLPLVGAVALNCMVCLAKFDEGVSEIE
jgi:hypothetical protein